MAVNQEDIRNLIRLFEDSEWQTMQLEVEGLTLAVSKTGALPGATAAPPPTVQAQPAPSAAAAPTAAPTPAPASPSTPEALALGPGQVLIRAPNLGVFWRQPKPGAPAYVEDGQEIDADTTVCLIEVMKLFTPVKAAVGGRLVRCLAQDGQMVEHDTPLFVVQQ